MMDENIFQRLEKAEVGMGVRDPRNYTFFMTVAEAIEIREEIHSLREIVEDLEEQLEDKDGH